MKRQRKVEFTKVLKNNYKMILYMNRYGKSQIAVSVICALSSTIITIINLLSIRYVCNIIMQKNSDSFFYMVLILSLSLVTSALLNFIISYLSNYITPRNAVKIYKNMRDELYAKAAGIGLQYYDDTDFYNKFMFAIEQSDQRALAVINSFANVLSSLFGVLGMSVIIGTLETDALCIIIVNVLLSFCINLIKSKKQHDYVMTKIPLQRKQNYVGRIFYLREYAKEIRMFTKLFDLLEEKLTESTNSIIDIINKFGRKLVGLSTINNVFGTIANCIIIVYIAARVIKGEMLIGDFLAVISGSRQFAAKLGNLLNTFPQLYEHSLYIDNFFEFMDMHETERKGGLPLDQIDEIKMENVGFSYSDSGKEVISNINIDIKRGQRIALVGKNGAGKSTIVKLLTCLYRVNSGVIYINGTSAYSYDLRQYRNEISVMLQDYELYAMSVAENVLMRSVTDKEKDEALVVEALKFVGLYDKILTFRNGIYTNITCEFNSEGVYLSGGERQKLALARIYAKQGSLIIMDEPSSALDPNSEREMFDKMRILSKEKCTVMISHRLKNITDVDMIYVLDSGKIIEKGSHRELMAMHGIYFAMYVNQNQGE